MGAQSEEHGARRLEKLGFGKQLPIDKRSSSSNDLPRTITDAGSVFGSPLVESTPKRYAYTCKSHGQTMNDPVCRLNFDSPPARFPSSVKWLRPSLNSMKPRPIRQSTRNLVLTPSFIASFDVVSFCNVSGCSRTHETGAVVRRDFSTDSPVPIRITRSTSSSACRKTSGSEARLNKIPIS